MAKRLRDVRRLREDEKLQVKQKDKADVQSNGHVDPFGLLVHRKGLG